jgi:hypothetical protein
VNETVPGQNRLREPFINRAQGEEAEPVVRKSTLPGASPGRTSTLLPRCKSDARHFAKVEARGAAPCARAQIQKVRSTRCTAAGAATPRGSAISGLVAQQTERRASNAEVAGASPAGAANSNSVMMECWNNENAPLHHSITPVFHHSVTFPLVCSLTARASGS